MNALIAHDLLKETYENMTDHQTSRDAVLAMLDLYNHYADQCPEVYQKLKNAGDSSNVWIIAE